MQLGDLLHILGQNDDGTQTTWFAELVGIDEDGDLEVFYLEQTEMCESYVWSYSSDWYRVSKDCLLQVFHPTKKSYLKTYKEFGFIPTVEENQFLKAGVFIPEHILIPMPLDSDIEESEEDISDTDSFFIDDDVANEPFSQADPQSSSFVGDMHKAVCDYNQWQPKDPSENQVKDFIDDLAKKYQSEDDNRQFARGKTVDYIRPPVDT